MGLSYSTMAIVKLAFAAWFLAWLSRLVYDLIVPSFTKKQKPIPPETSKFIQDQRRVANFGFLPDKSLENRLIARAIPNERLVEVYGIDNSFTTTSATAYRRFLSGVKRILPNSKTENWPRFFEAASTAFGLTLDQLSNTRGSLPLAAFVRQLVFLTTLYSFFDVNPEDVNLEDVGVATIAINDLWVYSKTDTSPEILQASRTQLKGALRRILPNRSTTDNPLNIIIPAYETMWRVVLLTYITAGFRDVDQDTADQFRQVVQGVPECFERGSSDNVATMAMNFSKEGLRLYPPTRRIYRDFDGEQQTADILQCHRDPAIWRDPERFRPGRFAPGEFTADMKRAYLPFSIEPHKCPAADRFAPHVIVILVVILAKGLGTLESGAEVRFGDEELDRDRSAVLPSGRLDTEEWTLRVRKKNV
ncbi:uncharacterized protein F4812DRAFT_467992 [Daldinia caldariorum]|uniref:uncharacterized protein n=1 Tax=Daldinia caldariorum TaxID=326644 RepID=UPI0020074C7C|nr:uncharacterized protein F4812DRAFT_467992 [Daldinia caldariorum]KAI1464356.1 hypothetical protein F4812DRAFT_467992 [Daldinia caldariorum]